ncbi:rifin [Plasmodium reichenowi]|uniref:Rifin n=1 Tax=Plasmodium reichenowi TaxID=5854 RepID=A0A060RM93_PLARE|nr:rifin [Plasmodium reichenowi]
MQVHYINILLFALPLNILVSFPQKEPSITPHKTKIRTTRLLCECELYAPANYDNDPQMKEVMDNFNKQTQQRFEEYDDRIQSKRKQCKDKCDKEIQKIILKDKMEKELMDKFATLQTDIQSDAIPTCICEKSIADKVEKGCLKCGGILGAAMPELGSIGGSLLSALYAWKPTALKVATQYAIDKGLAFGKVYGDIKGMKVVIGVLQKRGIAEYCPKIFEQIKQIESFTELNSFAGPIIQKHGEICGSSVSNYGGACTQFDTMLGLKDSFGTQTAPPPAVYIRGMIKQVAGKAETTAAHVAETTSERVAAEITKEQTNAINTIFMSNQTAIIASIVAIVVIVLIMVIIYLILRYRRKKTMKKKLQYIKLLEE